MNDFKITIMPVDTPPQELEEEENDGVPQTEGALEKLPVKRKKEKKLIEGYKWYEGIPVSQNKVMINTIKKYMKDHYDLVLPFATYMKREVAPDYFDVIAVESNLQLILERLENRYYRSIDQCYFEIELIGYNAVQYNGRASKYSEDAILIAKSMVNILKRKKMRKYATSSYTYHPLMSLPKSHGPTKNPLIRDHYESSDLNNKPQRQFVQERRIPSP